MAIPIKGVPTLYGEAAERMSRLIEEAEIRYENRPRRDITKDPRYIMVQQILEKSKQYRHLFE